MDFQALLQQLDAYSEGLNEQQHSVCEAYNRMEAIGFAVESIGRKAVPKHSDEMLEIRSMFESNNEKINRFTHAILNELKAWDGFNQKNMKYKTVSLDAFSVIGVKEFMPVENGENFTKIPQMWASLSEETMNRLGELSNLEPSGVLGVCAGMHDNGFDYWIAVATTKECPAGLEKLDIPAAQWIVFEITGAMPKAMQDGFKQILNEWLPTSGYQHADAPEIEWYSVGDMSSPDYKSEIWIPVIKQD